MERLAAVMRSKKYGFHLRSPKPSSWAVMVISLLTFVRFSVVIFESWTVVAHERQSDLQLLQLCRDGKAAESEKFRLLCLRARAEQASPILFKTIIHAVRSAWIDFCDSFNSPTKIALLVLFCISGVALPVVRLFSKLAEAHMNTSDGQVLQGLHGISFDDCDGDLEHSVLVAGGSSRGMLRLPFKVGKRRHPSPRIMMVEEADENGHSHAD